MIQRTSQKSYDPVNPSIPLTGVGGLFTRIGKIGGIINVINEFRGTTVPAKVDNLVLDYQDTDQNIINNLYNNLYSFQAANSAFPNALKTIANQLIVQMVNEDTSPLINNTSDAISGIIRYMLQTLDTVQSCNVTAGNSTDPRNYGNPVAVLSVKEQGGLVNENIFSELMVATVKDDYQTSPQYLYKEPFVVQGSEQVSDGLSWNFPYGSGAVVSVNAVNALDNQVGGNANWLNNGSMEAFTQSANIPDSWHISMGVTGNNFLQVTGGNDIYDGTSSFGIIGDGTTNSSFYQEMSMVGGTPKDTIIRITPNIQLAINLFAKVSVVPANGVLRVSLMDGVLVTKDDYDVQNSLDINLTTMTTSFAPYNCVFRTPSVLPGRILLELKLTVPLSMGSTLYLDRIAMSLMNVLYPGGPSLAIFSGNLPMIQNDKIYLNIYNDYAGQFQMLFNKLYGTRQAGLLLPSSSSPTIPDSLIL